METPATTAPNDPLDLDDDQRRWLGRTVDAVEGIGSAYGRQLESVGILTLQDLLLHGATRRGRQDIADRTGISGKLILRWVNNADLFRIRGVGTQYADLLEAAGVDTVVELALRRPENLVARLQTTNEIRSLVRQVPTEAQVTDWIAQAKELPRIVAY
jgi:predicted flap endonuclease-1-like 5' DNA nuclease